MPEEDTLPSTTSPSLLSSATPTQVRILHVSAVKVQQDWQKILFIARPHDTFHVLQSKPPPLTLTWSSLSILLDKGP